MYKVFDICEYICEYSNKQKCFLNQLKLQKILYFIQAEFLIVKKEPCFIEEIEAWDFGPVIPEVFYFYCKYGASSINYKEKYSYYYIEETDKQIINDIVDYTKDFSAAYLTDITIHQKPWSDYYNSCNNRYNIHSVIPKKAIQNYFEEGVKKNERHKRKNNRIKR